MNDQCVNCKIRKWCYREEPEEDWTCDYYEGEISEMSELEEYDNSYRWLVEDHETLGCLCKCPDCGYKAEAHTIKDLVSGHALAPFCPSCGAQMMRIKTVEMLLKYIRKFSQDTKVTFGNNIIEARYDAEMDTIDFH